MIPQHRLGGALAALLAALLSTPLAAAAAPVQSGPVKLVVIVSVDGLGWPRLNGYRPWFQEGFKRLLEEGHLQTDCTYRHLNTETGPGHASLSTGAMPRLHGIVANRWFEAAPDNSGLVNVYCTDQLPFYEEVGKGGKTHVFARERQRDLWKASGAMGKDLQERSGYGPDKKDFIFDSPEALLAYDQRHGLAPQPDKPAKVSGPANLLIPTLGDRLVETHPNSRVVSISGKDRAAIFLAGRNPAHFVYWYDRRSGRFTSSPAYDTYTDLGGAVNKVVQDFNRQQAGDAMPGRFGAVWSPLPEPAGATNLPRPEPNLGGFQAIDLGIGFDHDLGRHPSGYSTAVYNSPFQDQLLTDLAVTLLSDPKLALGRRNVPDLFAISFSAHDVVSHNYGNESEEELDALRRLDRELGRLLEQLDAIANQEPKGQVVLALSADHGFAPLPEVVRRHEKVPVGGKRPGGRLVGTDRKDDYESLNPNFQDRLNRGLIEELCLPADAQPIAGVEGWNVSYNPKPMRTVENDRDQCPDNQPVGAADLDRVIRKVVLRLFDEEVKDVLLTSGVETWITQDEEMLDPIKFARNDYSEGRSGSAFIVPERHTLMHWDPVRGSGHGSLYEYDTHVPLIFWGGPFRAGQRVEPSTPYDLAPTLADILGIEMPDAFGMSLRRFKR
jgi:arylsulfatase A-like enzyme